MTLSRDQLLVIIKRFTKELMAPPFITRLAQQVKDRGPQDANALFDELESLQKFLFVEWDIHPDVAPEDMLAQVHTAAKVHPDAEMNGAVGELCEVIENTLGRVASGGRAPQGGVPIHPAQLQLMQMAVQTALDDAERAYMAESQRLVMQGKPIDAERNQRMSVIQSKLVAYVQTMSSFLATQAPAQAQAAPPAA